MSKIWLVLAALLVVSLASPAPQEEIGETEFQAEEHAQTIGNLLKKLPSILSKTASWINGLGDIGDEVHPDVGEAIRQGASAVEEASQNVPEDIHSQVQEHLSKLINVTRVVQGHVNDTLRNIPEVKEKIAGLPGDDVILDVIESIPSADYVDEQIGEAINYFEPLAEAIGAQSNSTL
eukprot:TRINITY_DN16744_c0_g1_i1.p1 TRINITY_DN16744_c0_g1~~TRINITY_DN16744_c0_g1_i1.p1  ORF type:complete len:178 (+),score=56.08 TRINITY_DN16744_c0_g1_i1:48-581(+)